MTTKQSEILNEHIVEKIKVFVAYGEPLVFSRIGDAIAAIEAAPLTAPADASAEYYSISLYFSGGDNMEYTSQSKERIQEWLKLFERGDEDTPV